MDNRNELPETPGWHVFETSHRIVYNTRKPVPIKDVVTALQGLSGVLASVPGVVSGLTGVPIDGSEFLIQKLESGSLIEEVVIRFLFKDKAGLDAFIDKIGDNKVIKTAVVSIALTALAAYGLTQATSSKPASAITANNNVIINIGAGEVNMSPEQFAAVVRAAVGDKKALAESSLKFVKPAKSDPESSVTVSDLVARDVQAQPLQLTAAAIAEAPTRIDLEPNERIEEFRGAKLVIRATNLDSKTSGWAGKLDHREERLPIELDPSVSESEIFGRQSVLVDGALIFKEKRRSRELRPARIYVRRVIH